MHWCSVERAATDAIHVENPEASLREIHDQIVKEGNVFLHREKTEFGLNELRMLETFQCASQSLKLSSLDIHFD